MLVVVLVVIVAEIEKINADWLLLSIWKDGKAEEERTYQQFVYNIA